MVKQLGCEKVCVSFMLNIRVRIMEATKKMNFFALCYHHSMCDMIGMWDSEYDSEYDV